MAIDAQVGSAGFDLVKTIVCHMNKPLGDHRIPLKASE
jgi:hypothetical protein